MSTQYQTVGLDLTTSDYESPPLTTGQASAEI